MQQLCLKDFAPWEKETNADKGRFPWQCHQDNFLLSTSENLCGVRCYRVKSLRQWTNTLHLLYNFEDGQIYKAGESCLNLTRSPLPFLSYLSFLFCSFCSQALGGCESCFHSRTSAHDLCAFSSSRFMISVCLIHLFSSSRYPGKPIINLEDMRIYYKIILNVIYKPNIDSLSWGNSQDSTCKQDVC